MTDKKETAASISSDSIIRNQIEILVQNNQKLFIENNSSEHLVGNYAEMRENALTILRLVEHLDSFRV